MSGTLGYLLQQTAAKQGKNAPAEKGKNATAVADLFSKEIPTLAQPVIVEDVINPDQEQDNEKNPFLDEAMTAKQKKERDDRTIFIGNIPLQATSGQIVKEFTEYGKIEKVWIRSIPTETSKIPKKAQVILKQFKEGADRKNAYILFSTKEEAEKSLEANGKLFLEKHLRVDKANEKILDYTRTIFVGNLHFKITEEQVRKHFEDCGDILNVRIIRDPITHDGKGFGYVFFKEKSSYDKGLKMNGSTLLQRELRIKKAVPAERLEKKRERNEEKQTKINSENAFKRLKSKLKGKAVVHDNDEENAKEFKSKPVKKVKPNTTPSDNIPIKNFKNNIKTTSFNDNENDIYEFKNEMSIAPRVLRKKIKKLSKKGITQDAAFKRVQHLKKTKKANNDKNIFNSKFTMEARRDRRYKMSQVNKKKGKLEVQKEDRKDGKVQKAKKQAAKKAAQ